MKAEIKQEEFNQLLEQGLNNSKTIQRIEQLVSKLGVKISEGPIRGFRNY
jgi:uncharacterized protein YigA (DUF484 family)